MQRLVVTLETAKKLKEAGYPQDTEYGWIEETKKISLEDKRYKQFWDAAAPTAQELADELPLNALGISLLPGEMDERIWVASLLNMKSPIPQQHSGRADTLAEALAALWIALKENKDA